MVLKLPPVNIAMTSARSCAKVEPSRTMEICGYDLQGMILT
jgi:hypothetical protein